jgi:hypothetical protein
MLALIGIYTLFCGLLTGNTLGFFVGASIVVIGLGVINIGEEI